jgi:peptidoglycan/LPS O-acetylase OafA/YrhL
MSSPATLPADPIAPAAAPGDYAEYRGRKYFAELDGLRTLAMTTVVWNHAGHGDDNFGQGLGVKLFFVISGFLITTLLLRERHKTGGISLPDFYRRRTLRIFPLYFATLGLYTLLVLVRLRGTPAGEQFFGNLPYYLTFTANWFISLGAGHVVFYFAWSLSAQEQFYLVWPAVMRAARGRWLPVALMLAAIAVGVTMEALLEAGRLDRGVLGYRILAGFPVSIGLGFLAAYLLDDEAGYGLVRRLLRQPWSPLAGIALMLLQVVRPATHDLVPALGAVLLVTSCVVQPRNVLAPLLDLRLMRHIGTVSLGIYLLHMLGINVARIFLPNGSRAALFAIAFPLSILAATASHRWFENPIASRARRPRAAPATTVAMG